MSQLPAASGRVADAFARDDARQSRALASLSKAALAMPRRFDVDRAALSQLATVTGEVELFRLQPRELIVATVMWPAGEWTGPGLTGLTFSVGTAANPVKYLPATAMNVPPGPTVFAVSNVVGMETLEGDEPIVLAASASGCNLDQLLGGAAVVHVLTVRLR